jgi:CHAT domain-containing protein
LIVADFKDVELRIRGAKAGGNGQPSIHDVEVRVDGSGLWVGESTLDVDGLDPSDPEKYGKALGRQLANPTVFRALDQAGLSRGERIRLRLVLDDDKTAPHSIRWERLWLPIAGDDWRIAVHPRVAFSRYIPVQSPDGDPPDALAFRLLFAVANPAGLADNRRIDVETEIAKFVEEFESGPLDRRLQVSVLPGRTGISAALQDRLAKQHWQIVTGPASVQNISDRLHQKFHGLHILAHGDYSPDDGVGSLLLENADGGKAQVDDPELQSWLTPELQLIVFHACLSAGTTAEGRAPFTGLAPRLIRLGLPASVAMQDFVEMEDARVFFSEFYRALLDEGLVDVAVNRGRQRLVGDPRVDNWSIPALFSRLRGGRLWCADPIRQSIANALIELPRDSQTWAPLQVIEHTRGIAGYKPVEGASGPRLDLWKRASELAATPGSFTILTGSRGSLIAAQLRRLFRTTATLMLGGASAGPWPVFLTLAELAGRASPLWPILQRIWTGTARPEDEARVEGRRFLFLIDGEEELAGVRREHALAAISRLRALPESAVFLLADELLIPALTRDFESATLLVAQQLDPAQVSSYLDELGTPSSKNVRDAIREGGYSDLASQPRFLQHMLDLASREVPLRSRRSILERVAAIYLARMDTRRVPGTCTEDALERIAWAIQMGRSHELAPSQLLPLLAEARGSREFPLSDLNHGLVTECRLLVPNGDEGVRFTYPVMQAYFAARYLADAPDRTRLVEDITASLGRLARLRRWQKVLVLAATMVPSPAEILHAVLAGSSLMEGEQLFLAVRCYQEVIAERGHADDLREVVDQMVDTLIWRSSWATDRPYADRRKAVDSLVALAPLCGGDHLERDIIPHFVALACDPRQPLAEKPEDNQYDWCGIRQSAVNGLARVYEQTTAYVNANRPDLAEPLRAWWELKENPEATRSLLFRDDPRVSVIAAFGLADSPREEDRDMLVDAYERVRHADVKWGIVNALSGGEASWVQRKVVHPWIRRIAQNDGSCDDLRAAHACYLIQKSSLATPEARAFLAKCLQTGSPSLQGRALRAYAKLHDLEIEQWLRPLCEQVVSGTIDRIDPGRMQTVAADLSKPALQRAALETLRDIGNAASIDVVRRARGRNPGDHELRQLSFQVAEEMYWRLTGGLDSETIPTEASQRH